jgi:hypothetical protein
MKRFSALLAIIVVTAIALVIIPGGEEPIFGLPAVRVAPQALDWDWDGKPAWLSVGGVGVLCLGGGTGVVTIGFYGVGLLFAVGQMAAGSIAIAQLGFGLVFALVQVGAGLTGFGQLVFGGAVVGQVPVGFRGTLLIEALSRDLDDLLSFRRALPDPMDGTQ